MDRETKSEIIKLIKEENSRVNVDGMRRAKWEKIIKENTEKNDNITGFLTIERGGDIQVLANDKHYDGQQVQITTDYLLIYCQTYTKNCPYLTKTVYIPWSEIQSIGFSWEDHSHERHYLPNVAFLESDIFTLISESKYDDYRNSGDLVHRIQSLGITTIKELLQRERVELLAGGELREREVSEIEHILRQRNLQLKPKEPTEW